jgi:pentose-5-phosphate-3-epimerase
MAQQTAVEWLTTIHLQTNKIDNFDLEVAKEMEKQQITFAYNDGADAIVAGKYKSMEDYYNELYQSHQDKADK